MNHQWNDSETMDNHKKTASQEITSNQQHESATGLFQEISSENTDSIQEKNNTVTTPKLSSKVKLICKKCVLLIPIIVGVVVGVVAFFSDLFGVFDFIQRFYNKFDPVVSVCFSEEKDEWIMLENNKSFNIVCSYELPIYDVPKKNKDIIFDLPFMINNKGSECGKNVSLFFSYDKPWLCEPISDNDVIFTLFGISSNSIYRECQSDGHGRFSGVLYKISEIPSNDEIIIHEGIKISPDSSQYNSTHFQIKVSAENLPVNYINVNLYFINADEKTLATRLVNSLDLDTAHTLIVFATLQENQDNYFMTSDYTCLHLLPK